MLHRHPAEDEADDLLGFQRAMIWLRLLGILLIATQGWLYAMLHPALLWAAAGIELGVVALQGRLLAQGLPIAALRRRAAGLLVADLVAVYLIGTVFAVDAAWVGFYFYPLMSLEATLVAGPTAGVLVTGLSVLLYLAQLVLHVSAGNPLEPRTVLASLSLIAMTGGFVTLYAHLAERHRASLRALLNLTSALSLQRSDEDAIHELDRRVHAAMGARVRSIAIREPDGRYRLARWHTAEHRHLTEAQLLRAFDDVESLAAHLAAGESATFETDAWSVVTASLGLPEWTAAVTLVPIIAEAHWIGVLPVLWPARTVPGRDELQLLHGLAGQIGLALARGELARMRAEQTVDTLTGLSNRRAIEGELAAFVARAARSDGRLAVLLCRLRASDGQAGVGAADLRAVAGALRGVLRHGDVAGRHGDDQLLVIAAEADNEAAAVLAARIRAAAAGTAVSLAIGIAAYPGDGPTMGDLLDAADTAVAMASLGPSRSDAAEGVLAGAAARG